MLQKAKLSDAKRIMEIINAAQIQFKVAKIDQWQNNYPNLDTIESDINNNSSYVYIIDKKIVATVYFSFEVEETYLKIYNGKWISNHPYGVIHRLAVDLNYQNQKIAQQLLLELFKIAIDNNIYSIKVDTHKDNIVMRKLLEKLGFQYCGIIYLKDKSERLAYEKILNKIE